MSTPEQLATLENEVAAWYAGQAIQRATIREAYRAGWLTRHRRTLEGRDWGLSKPTGELRGEELLAAAADLLSTVQQEDLDQLQASRRNRVVAEGMKRGRDAQQASLFAGMKNEHVLLVADTYRDGFLAGATDMLAFIELRKRVDESEAAATPPTPETDPEPETEASHGDEASPLVLRLVWTDNSAGRYLFRGDLQELDRALRELEWFTIWTEPTADAPSTRQLIRIKGLDVIGVLPE